MRLDCQILLKSPPLNLLPGSAPASDVMFSDKFLMSDILATNLMLTGLLFSTFPLILGRKYVRFVILSSFYHSITLMCVWLSFQTKEALFAALRLTFYINYKRHFHSMRYFALFLIQRGYSRFVRCVNRSIWLVWNCSVKI